MSRTVFITGASSGFGMALASLFADAGDRVALVARRQERLDALAEQIKAGGGTALPIVCDVSNRASVQEAVRQCEAELGPVDVLIANAGVNKRNSVSAFSAEDVEWVLRINLIGVIYCIDAVMPGMIERQSGHIVGVSSLASYGGLSRSAAYCASKAALNNLLESLRIDLRPHNVAVTTLCPGYVKTELTEDNTHKMPFLMELDQASRKMFKAIQKRKSQYGFPWPLAFAAKFGRFVPRALYDRVNRNWQA